MSSEFEELVLYIGNIIATLHPMNMQEYFSKNKTIVQKVVHAYLSSGDMPHQINFFDLRNPDDHRDEFVVNELIKIYTNAIVSGTIITRARSKSRPTATVDTATGVVEKIRRVISGECLIEMSNLTL